MAEEGPWEEVPPAAGAKVGVATELEAKVEGAMEAEAKVVEAKEAG